MANRKEKKQASHAELVALDFGASGLKALRLRRYRDQVHLLGADILAPIQIDRDAPPDRACRLTLPAPVQAKYAAIALNTPHTRVRLLAMPTASDGPSVEKQLREQMALEDGDRLGMLPVSVEPGRPPSRVLVASLPEKEIQLVLGLTSSGPPAPCSLQPAGIATFNAFQEGPGKRLGNDAAMLIETGSHSTFVYCVHRGIPVLVRRHDQGAESIVHHLHQQLGVDRDLALTVLSDGAVDVTAAFHQAMGPLFKQLCIARDFVERQESCAVRHLFVSGGMSRSRLWREALAELLSLPASTWDPLDMLTRVPGSYPERLHGEEWRFAAAVGVGLGALERDAHVHA